MKDTVGSITRTFCFPACQAKCTPVSSQQLVSAGYIDPTIRDLLINFRTELAQLIAISRCQDEVPGIIVYAHSFDPCERQPNCSGVRARPRHEVVFQVAAIGVKDEVNTFVDARDADAGKVWNILASDSGASE